MKTNMIALVAFLLIASHAEGATKYGAQATKYQNSTIPGLVSQGHERGNIKHCLDSYALTADLGLGDVIRMCKIPQGAKVIDARMRFDALTKGLLDAGWLAGAKAVEAASTAGLMDRVAVTSAGVASTFTTYSASAGFMKTFSEEVQSVVVVNTDTSATSGTIYLEILYVID